MKEFLKYTAATIVGLLVFTIIIVGIGLMSIVGMIASGESSGPVAENSVLVLPLTGTLEERAEDNTLERLIGNGIKEIGLDEIIDGINKARDNDNIKGIYIEAGAFAADSYASLQAIRKALIDFKKSGKWIVAYGDSVNLLHSIGGRQSDAQPTWNNRLARNGFATVLSERPHGEIRSKNATRKSRHIQECTGDVHCRQDERF